ncbi:acid protease [Teratosphaeria destructans]|uniref:Acid protease n=1 Tax=Teratosphaeria destructans TaxID=418781 RepID=A0A9W7SQZ1_9PEZI|nr:acid protease [Teratosphaeria destructans]
MVHCTTHNCLKLQYSEYAMRLASTIAPLALLSEVVLASEPKVVSHSIRRHNRQPDRLARRSRKRDVAANSLFNNVPLTLYEVNITVGTPEQPITLDIDTGSSDIWMFSKDVYANCSGYCTGGSFDASKSSTYKLTGEDAFEIQYADSTGASGDYFTDTVHLSNASATNVTLAVATSLDEWDLVSPGIMGIGFDSNEASEEEYAGFIDDLVQQGLINTRSYSLWLDDLQASTGTILFGGYDTGKFDGNLTILEIQEDPDYGVIDGFYVAFTSLTFTNSTKSIALTSEGLSEGLPALLDSGTSLTYVPTEMYTELANHFGAYTNDSNQQVLVPCDIGEGSLEYGFGGGSSPVVKVPFSELAELAWDSSVTPPAPIMLSSGKQACLFGLQPADSDDEIVFGDTFLRSAYVVYDIDQKLIGLGQSNFNSTSSHLVEIPTGDNPFGTIGVTVSSASISATGGTSSMSTKPGHAATASADATSSGSGAAITGMTTSIAGATYTTGSASATATGKSGAGPQYAGMGLAAVAGVAAFAL